MQSYKNPLYGTVKISLMVVSKKLTFRKRNYYCNYGCHEDFTINIQIVIMKKLQTIIIAITNSCIMICVLFLDYHVPPESCVSLTFQFDKDRGRNNMGTLLNFFALSMITHNCFGHHDQALIVQH